jgi:hypothetical protein
MINYQVWEEESLPVFFPIPSSSNYKELYIESYDMAIFSIATLYAAVLKSGIFHFLKILF